MVRAPVYPGDYIRRRVLADGTIRVDNDRVSVGKPLIGYRIGLRHEGGLRWHAYFFNCDLGSVEVAGHGDIAEPLAQVGDIGGTEGDADGTDDASVSTVNQPAP
jgi:hypothetical protein